MRPKLFWLTAGALLVGMGAADAKPPDIYPISEVKRGQKGYGLTTMSGTTPERFEFEVIGVSRNFLPKMDIVLVKSDDRKLDVSGFWRGMSGSPLFIDGKLVCAFSYGFRFNKAAIGGCTPIEYMMREGFRPPRWVSDEARPTRQGGAATRRGASPRDTRSSTQTVVPQSVASLEEWRALTGDGTLDGAFASLGEPRAPWILSAPRPAGTRAPAGEEGLTPAGVPLALAGFSAPAFQAARELMTDYPLEPIQGGGTGSRTDGPTEFQLGGAIAVELIRGDMSAAATGTVSYVDGGSVLAFGHPLFEAGELYAPVASAEILTVIPSSQIAFIMASPMRELGTLIHDRKSTIMADTGLRTRMVPIHISVNLGKGEQKEVGTFQVEVMQNRFFTGTLANIAALNAINHYMPDRDRVSARIDSRVTIKGHGTIEFVDHLHSSTGAMGLIGGARGLRALVPLLMNPFAPIEIERVDIDVHASYDTNYGNIESIRVPSAELRPGTRSYVLVELSTYSGDRIVERVPFEIPARLAGSVVRLEVTSGDSTRLDAAPPQSLADLIGSLRKLLPGNVFAVTLYSADEGVAIGGRLVRDLPASALDKLKTATSTGPAEAYNPLYRSLRRTNRVISGRQQLLVKVADLDN